MCQVFENRVNLKFEDYPILDYGDRIALKIDVLRRSGCDTNIMTFEQIKIGEFEKLAKEEIDDKCIGIN